VRAKETNTPPREQGACMEATSGVRRPPIPTKSQPPEATDEEGGGTIIKPENATNVVVTALGSLLLLSKKKGNMTVFPGAMLRAGAEEKKETSRQWPMERQRRKKVQTPSN
jgi:hypothetical protein